jgi:hypothetical protein
MVNEAARSKGESASDPSQLRATVLFAYYGLLREGRAGAAIGSAEILAWIEARLPDEPAPSLSLVQKVLHEHSGAHRRAGRPRADSQVHIDAPPLCAVRAKQPRSREPK